MFKLSKVSKALVLIMVLAMIISSTGLTAKAAESYCPIDFDSRITTKSPIHVTVKASNAITQVKIYIDNKLIYSDSTLSENCLSYDTSVGHNLSLGMHNIYIEAYINDEIEKYTLTSLLEVIPVATIDLIENRLTVGDVEELIEVKDGLPLLETLQFIVDDEKIVKAKNYIFFSSDELGGNVVYNIRSKKIIVYDDYSTKVLPGKFIVSSYRNGEPAGNKQMFKELFKFFGYTVTYTKNMVIIQ